MASCPTNVLTSRIHFVNYSCLSATTGCTLEARWASRKPAIAATTTSAATAIMIVGMSPDFRPYNRPEITLAASARSPVQSAKRYYLV